MIDLYRMKPLVIVGLILFLGGMGIVGYVFRDRFNKKPTGLEINTSPASAVYLNDKNVGSTPYSNKNLEPGSYTLRLVPESTGGPALSPWETRLELSSLVTTVINRTFAEAETDASGSVLQLVKEPGNKTYLSVISDPDTVSVTIDGKPSGFTPVTKIESSPGSHSLEVTSPGYKSQDLTVNTVKGYNLIVNTKLAIDQIVLSQPIIASEAAGLADSVASSPAATSSAAPSAKPSSGTPNMAKPYVVVQETGTGWLRVRKEPSATADELGKADVGEQLQYLGETTETGWHKIEFEDSTGWVSGKYVELVK